jgi:hypothetical protein
MAINAPLPIDQGATFSTIIELFDANNEPIVVNGYTAVAQIKKNYTSSNAFNFTTALANGSITLTLPADVSSAMTPGRYVYDVKIITSANTYLRIVEGIVTIRPQVS